jgi:hypothetical protein
MRPIPAQHTATGQQRRTAGIDRHRLRIVPLGMSLGLFLAISFVLCLLLGLIVPDARLHMVWLQFLPGFVWLTWQSVLLGLVESLAYGWYAAMVFVPLYNFFAGRPA